MNDETIKEPKEEKKMRRIVIETDGDSVHIISADVAGTIEFMGIMQMIINSFNKKA